MSPVRVVAPCLVALGLLGASRAQSDELADAAGGRVEETRE